MNIVYVVSLGVGTSSVDSIYSYQCRTPEFISHLIFVLLWSVWGNLESFSKFISWAYFIKTLSQNWRFWSISMVDRLLRAPSTWWRHQMETFFALLTFCAGNSPVSGEFLTQRPLKQSFDVFFDLCLDGKRRWFETPSRTLWRHCNGSLQHFGHVIWWTWQTVGLSFQLNWRKSFFCRPNDRTNPLPEQTLTNQEWGLVNGSQQSVIVYCLLHTYRRWRIDNYEPW